MSRLVLSFIRDNYKKEFDDLIKILKGVSIWMLATEGTYTKDMFYRKNGGLRKGLAKSLDKPKNKLIIRLFEQDGACFKSCLYYVLEKSEDIKNLKNQLYLIENLLIYNDKHLAHHEGGFSTFRVRIDEHLNEENILKVKVDKIYKYDNFEQLYEKHDKIFCGDCGNSDGHNLLFG